MRSNPELHYLDNAATTMVDPAVADAISHALQSCWATPSSLYEPAVEVHEELSAALKAHGVTMAYDGLTVEI